MTLRSIGALAAAGHVQPADTAALERVAARYAVALTPHLADRIGTAADDPIAAQFIPHPDELETMPEERADPIGDTAHSPVPGIVHRYPDRVLLKLLHVCPVYCRFCFRREVVGPGETAMLSAEDTDAALHYIAEHPAIWEVILTGGDPLLLSPRRLTALMARLAMIAHVKVVRFHTRVPVADPARITDDLVAALKRFGRALYVVLHANHVQEFSAEADAACGRLIDAGLPMLGQSVLLKGVNDTPDRLEALMRHLVENRIKPYYLHHPDLAPGTRRFRTGIADGQELVAGLRGRISGLCQPTYVLDIPGGFGKVPLALCASSEPAEDGARIVTDRNGVAHRYPPNHETCG